jgi:hypothetical protein
MNAKLQSLYGLKFHPFRPDVPTEALYATPATDAFIRRVELGIADGGRLECVDETELRTRQTTQINAAVWVVSRHDNH